MWQSLGAFSIEMALNKPAVSITCQIGLCCNSTTRAAPLLSTSLEGPARTYEMSLPFREAPCSCPVEVCPMALIV